jgi:dTDP-glucose 4,6-dehydratase
MDTLLITGGAGFIGSNLVHRVLATTPSRVVVLDKLTYAGSLLNLTPVRDDPRFTFVQGDIGDRPLVNRLLAEHRPRAVLNLAAESHVDRSIDSPDLFVQTNIVGTSVLLAAADRYRQQLGDAERERFRFLHVSTDEVYGTLGPTGLFHEGTPYAPNSPYAASKAAADHMVRAYTHTYGLPAILTNCSNNYGPYQFPEKLIPLMILNGLEGRPLPIYGDGGNVRDWLHVDDHCAGLLLALERGRPGEKYNIGGGNERTNLDIVDRVCEILQELQPAASNPSLNGRSYQALKTFVADRPGHDRRYAIDATKIRGELGWTPRYSFEQGLRDTAKWYVDNREWCGRVQAGRYDRQRLGLG